DNMLCSVYTAGRRILLHAACPRVFGEDRLERVGLRAADASAAATLGLRS
ncbi:hypothetical protein NDU88_003202, partial [Pleurodeles waltl]